MPFATIGHQHLWDFLSHAAAQNTLAHAYAFIGPEHVGKRHLADKLAALLLCHAQQRETRGLFEASVARASVPCGQCPSCQALTKHRHQDFLLVEPAAGEQAIPIETIRVFLSRLSQSPALGQRKVAVIDGAETLTLAAANALLKHLEEPTATTTLVLIVHDRSRLLPTILSRCQVIEFERVYAAPEPTPDATLWQESHGLPGLYQAYRLSPSLAQQALDEQSRFWDLFEMTPGQRLALLDSFFSKKKNTHSVAKHEWDTRLACWQQAVRQGLLRQISQPRESNKMGLTEGMYIRLYDALLALRAGLRKNINVRAHVERFLLDLNA